MSDSRITWAALALVLMGMGVSGCNTTEGFGQDMQSAGEELEEEADEAK
jgi:predicted small secreted protein